MTSSFILLLVHLPQPPSSLLPSSSSSSSSSSSFSCLSYDHRIRIRSRSNRFRFPSIVSFSLKGRVGRGAPRSAAAEYPAAADDDGGAVTGRQKRVVSSDSSISLGIREPVYEVIEVKSDGTMSTKRINRRRLLKSSGLCLRDLRSVDPSLWLTNSMPSLLVREQAILLNFGSLRAIAMHERVLLFDYNRKGGKAFLRSLLPRLNPKNINGGPAMPFELENPVSYYCVRAVFGSLEVGSWQGFEALYH